MWVLHWKRKREWKEVRILLGNREVEKVVVKMYMGWFRSCQNRQASQDLSYSIGKQYYIGPS